MFINSIADCGIFEGCEIFTAVKIQVQSVEVVLPSEKLVPFRNTTWRHNTEDVDL
jgi:hypothetical protein